MELQPIKPLPNYSPNVSLMHQDDGNTASSELLGPLGNMTTMTSYTTHTALFLRDSHGRLTTGGVIVSAESTTPTYTLNAVDPDTLQILATWVPPDDQTLSLAYLVENGIAISSTAMFVITCS